MTLLHDVEGLESEVLAALSGGQTRSALELVTDLAAPYDAVQSAVESLIEKRVIARAYSEDDETFYGRA